MYIYMMINEIKPASLDPGVLSFHLKNYVLSLYSLIIGYLGASNSSSLAINIPFNPAYATILLGYTCLLARCYSQQGDPAVRLISQSH